MNDKNHKLLKVINLHTYFHHEEGLVKAVDGISFEVEKGETLGIVGESGCGKSVTCLSIMQLVPQPRGKIEEGNIYYNSDLKSSLEITALKPHGKKMRSLRGKEIAMIFQEPMTALTPVFTIGKQIMEAVMLHQNYNKKQARARAIEMLDLVGIGSPEQRVDDYPHELSGGQRQRAIIGMALSCNPSLLIADEPTTALDVTIEAQILELIEDLKDELNMSIIFITHDLDVIGEIADRGIVMYTGKIVEKGNIINIFHDSKHPYTKGLLKSTPRIGSKSRLVPIEGSVPDLKHLPNGCYFVNRCAEAIDKCEQESPPTININENQEVRCWLFNDASYERGEKTFE